MTIHACISSGKPLAKILALILFVLGNWCAYSFAAWFVSPTRDLPQVSIVGAENFEGGSIDGTLPEISGRFWLSISGDWEVDRSALRLKRSSAEMNLFGIDVGGQGSIKAMVVGDSYCGLAANVVDTNNYVALLRAKPFGVWNVVEGVHGKAERLGTLPDPGTRGVVAELRVVDDRAWAFVGDSVASFRLQNDLIGQISGFAQSGDGSPQCWFDDAVVMARN